MTVNGKIVKIKDISCCTDFYVRLFYSQISFLPDTKFRKNFLMLSKFVNIYSENYWLFKNKTIKRKQLSILKFFQYQFHYHKTCNNGTASENLQPSVLKESNFSIDIFLEINS